MSFKDMMRKQILRAAVLGGIIVLMFVEILGVVFGFALFPTAVSADNIIQFLATLIIPSFIAGFITVYVIMSMAVKKLVALFMPPPKAAKPAKKE